ncbi:MAG: Mov34/MPN/PAD-1 family protein [Methanobacteriota archaeon]|nr:MAG: Mov34/MPN/PAD-1 family protein [Euryarchaeota archaeon]
MAKPRVIREVRRDPLNRPPPQDISPHPWFTNETKVLYDEALRRGHRLEIYMSSLAEEKMREQSLRAAPRRLEVMGLLLGDVCSWGGRTYSIIRDVGTTDLENSPAKVKFDPSALPRLFNDLDRAGFDYVVVGWYHSHPGHTCFMSRVDLRTQKRAFTQGYHCSVVIDPVSREVRAFKLTGEGYSEVPFALVAPEALRFRRLKPLSSMGTEAETR